ncbi:MAG: hypothetical protein GF419_09905 [Ignavibacteriales bacterium]|jgi:predicted Fe-Mo cluster-binding NifX family protein|nr:hypothetical protein [Ignavibacteriales bacterium]
MKIAISSGFADRDRPPPMGRSPMFFVVDSVGERSYTIDNTPNAVNDPDAGVWTAELLHERGVKVVIAGDVDRQAAKYLREHGIVFFEDCRFATPGEAYKKFISGELEPANELPA